MKKVKITPYEKVESVIPTALIAVILIILQAFISLEKLDVLALLAVISFAISLPLLATVSIVLTYALSTGLWPSERKTNVIIYIVGLTAYLFAYVGIALVIFRLSLIAGIFFLAFSFVGIIVSGIFVLKFFKVAPIDDKVEEEIIYD